MASARLDQQFLVDATLVGKSGVQREQATFRMAYDHRAAQLSVKLLSGAAGPMPRSVATATGPLIP